MQMQNILLVLSIALSAVGAVFVPNDRGCTFYAQEDFEGEEVSVEFNPV